MARTQALASILFRPLMTPVAVALLFSTPMSPGARALHGQQPPPRDLFAPASPEPGAPVETRHLTLTASAGAAVAAPGSRVTLRMDVVPKPKMHVYAPEQKDVISVTLLLKPDQHIRPGAVRFPVSEKYFFAPLNETQRVYSKPFRIVQDVTVADTPAVRRRARAADARLTITGTVRYQACDEAICYLPQEVPVSWTIALEPSGPR